METLRPSDTSVSERIGGLFGLHGIGTVLIDPVFVREVGEQSLPFIQETF